MRLAWGAALAGLAGLAVGACSALIGVEDVRLASARDAASPEEGSVAPPDDATVVDAATTPEASVQLALGYLHTCARKGSGTVQCWGENGGGQLGNGVSLDGGGGSPVLLPVSVVSVSDAVAIASGLAHSCVVRKAGTVACWGTNGFGQLGDGTNDNSSSPVAVAGLNDAVDVAAGTSFTCALHRGGTVSCWGADYSGQLGDGLKVDRSVPALVKQLDGVTAIAAGEHHACAIVAGGAVKCWGGNDDGQLGNGTTTESLVPTLASLTGAAQVVAASRFTCARLGSGQVNCWGANTLGELGTGSENAAPNPSPAVTGVSDAVSIWVGYQHACAARASGEVVCWGEAGSGQVGAGSVPDDASIPRPTAVVGVSGALAVATGGEHSCATTRSGAVLCWGANSLGQLGNGTAQRAYAAVAVPGFP
jgi:alpha-tubulin suppressor-like RCC1 family protein